MRLALVQMKTYSIIFVIILFMSLTIMLRPALGQISRNTNEAETIEGKAVLLIDSLLLPGTSWRQDLPDKSIQETFVYLPFVIKEPMGMVFVPAGEFWMGCPTNPCWFGSELVHKVYLDSFFIDQYEITNIQYSQCVAAGNCAPPVAVGSHTRPSYYDNPTYANYPVFHISWDNAVDYCQWVGKRLPTEAEWEKAAQGGQDPTVDPFPWGNAAPVCDIGAPNGAQWSDCAPADSVQVGSFGPSKNGQFDMAGNVWEWVNDWYDLSYYAISPYSNPQGPDSGTDKVIRGGSWNYMWTGLQVYDRNFRDPNTPLNNHDVGFRCVFSPLR